MLPDQDEYIPQLFRERITEKKDDLSVSVEVAVQTMWLWRMEWSCCPWHRDMNIDHHGDMVHTTWNGLQK